MQDIDIKRQFGFVQQLDEREILLSYADRPMDRVTILKEESSELVKILERIKSDHIPLFIESDSARNEQIFHCPIPAVTKSIIEDHEHNRLMVEFVGIQTRYHLRHEDTAHFRETRQKLSESEQSGNMIWIAVIDFDPNPARRGEIVGVIDNIAPDDPVLNVAQPQHIPFNAACYDEIDTSQAEKLFHFVESFSTDIDDDPVESIGSIPFTFLVSGCISRAHRMCRLIMEEGTSIIGRCVQPAKLWVFGDLQVRTTNHPFGEAEWSFHVAPLVKTSGGFSVIDPSVCENAVPVREWLEKISGTDALTCCTDTNVYLMTADQLLFENDRDGTLTESDLRRLQSCLRLMIHRFGKPPYTPSEFTQTGDPPTKTVSSS